MSIHSVKLTKRKEKGAARPCVWKCFEHIRTSRNPRIRAPGTPTQAACIEDLDWFYSTLYHYGIEDRLITVGYQELDMESYQDNCLRSNMCVDLDILTCGGGVRG